LKKEVMRKKETRDPYDGVDATATAQQQEARVKRGANSKRSSIFLIRRKQCIGITKEGRLRAREWKSPSIVGPQRPEIVQDPENA